MAKKIIEARVIQKVGTAQEWADDDFVLMDGEMGFERTSTGLPVNFKVGEGDKRYSELAYFHPYIINGSISTTQTIAELNALSNGVYSAKGAGVYANGLESYEGQYTTFRKTEDGWSLDARVDVTWESPDLDPIENELADHEQRITAEENKSLTFTNQISQHSNRIRDLQNTISNFKDYNVWLNNSYEILGNPQTQEAYNTRLLNYVQNGLSNNSNFKTNTSNNVTNSFNFGTLEWRFSQTTGVPYITASGYTTRFGSKLTHEQNEDNIGELDKTGVGGKLEGVNWKVQKLSGQTQASNINLPITGAAFRTAIVSVNGQFADENGNIVVSGGGGGYILPPASAGTLGGIKVGSGLTITPDGVLSATGGGGGGATYTAGDGININGSNVISVNFGTTSTTVTRGDDSRVNNGQTAFTWGNHATQGYIKNNFYTIDGTITSNRTIGLSGNKLSFNNGITKVDRLELTKLTSNLNPNTLYTDGADVYLTNEFGVTSKLLKKVDNYNWGRQLTPEDEDITIGSYRGMIVNKPCRIKSFFATCGTAPTGSGVVVGMLKNNVTITTINATVLPNNKTSATNATQPTFSSDTFVAGDDIRFFIPAGGIGSVNAGQNLEVYLEFELL